MISSSTMPCILQKNVVVGRMPRRFCELNALFAWSRSNSLRSAISLFLSSRSPPLRLPLVISQ